MKWLKENFKRKFGKTIIDYEKDGFKVGQLDEHKFIPTPGVKFYYREIIRDIKRFFRLPI